jgi:hypothetical protein
MKIAFHVNELNVRGSEGATFKYAHFNEKLLNNKSYILAGPLNTGKGDHRGTLYEHPLAQEYFGSRFPVYRYNSWAEAEAFLKGEEIDMLYMQKAGGNDGLFSKDIKTCVHSVFQICDPHGDVYAYISEWLSKTMDGGKHPFVPYIVTLPDVSENLREELGIPPDAVVLGRTGGPETFDLEFVHNAIKEVLNERDDIYFLFLYTYEFMEEHPRVKHFPATMDKEWISKFINTCDGMIHARGQGESFGLSVAEFSIKNKPIITWNGSGDRAHIDMLGDKGLYYGDQKEAKDIMLDFTSQPEKNWDAYSEHFSPENSMNKFKEVFIDG